MRYKHFKNADVDVSALAVGTWATGSFVYGDVTDDDSIAAIRTMLDGGVNLIDTAPAYGAGYAEKVVGRAIKGYDRSKLFLSTKGTVNVTCLKSIRAGGGYQRDGSYANVL